MGNDQSDLKKFVIDNKSIETTDCWTLHYAEVPKSDPPILVSVFRSVPGEEGQLGPFFFNQFPLIRAIRVCGSVKVTLDNHLFVLLSTESKNLSSPIAVEVYFIVERW